MATTWAHQAVASWELCPLCTLYNFINIFPHYLDGIFISQIFSWKKFWHSLLDNAPIYLVGCVIQKRIKHCDVVGRIEEQLYRKLTAGEEKGSLARSSSWNYLLRGPGKRAKEIPQMPALDKHLKCYSLAS